MKNNIAIDGPAGAGKSTIAKKLAAKDGGIAVICGSLYLYKDYHDEKNTGAKI